ncbi:MAG: GTP-binding protein [Blautia sp.]|nr:GTP-binding protein [Blautia sp.]
MVKIDIVSGFLGAGKTTLIKKLLAEAFKDEQVVLIENEFGEIGIDGSFLKESGIQIREMNSGCICCSLVGDFGTSLREVVETYHPDRILIEPSGVGKLSDVIKAVQGVQKDVDMELNSYTTVVDAKKCKMYMRNFGEFFNNQVEYAGAIILSRTDIVSEDKAAEVMNMLREINKEAAIITTPIAHLDGKKILEVMEKPVSLEQQMLEEEEVCPECGHVHAPGEHHHHDHDEHEHDHDEHDHHHDHDEHHHDHDEHEHHHDHDHDEHHHDHDHDEHHHDHDEHDHHYEHDHDEHDHHHDHDHDEHDHHHDHDHHGHHHHHHADEVFSSWGRETVKKYSKEEIEQILNTLSTSDEYGIILRAKGMLPSEDGTWTYFDMVPEEIEIREGAPDFTGRFCVIGSKMDEHKLEELWSK